MYKIFIANRKTERKLIEYMRIRKDIKEKLQKLRTNPREDIGAHPLHGRLDSKWSCWLGSNIRIIYSIKDDDRLIIIEAVGTHKIY